MYTVEELKWVTYDVFFFQNIPVEKWLIGIYSKYLTPLSTIFQLNSDNQTNNLSTNIC